MDLCFLALILVCLTGQVRSQAGRFLAVPTNVTTTIGERVSFQWRVVLNADIFWIANPSRVIIFRSDIGLTPSLRDDYDVQGSGASIILFVKSANARTAGRYSYGFQKARIGGTVDLTVLESVEVIAPACVEGKHCEVGCSGVYHKSFSHVYLRLSVAANGFFDKLFPTEVSLGLNGDGRRLTGKAINFRPSYEYDEGTLQCEMYTSRPPFALNTPERPLHVAYAVRDIEISPDHTWDSKSKLHVNDKLSCKARGNPVPDYIWTVLEAPPNYTIPDTPFIGPEVTIVEEMKGEGHLWKCTAFNQPETEIKYVEKEIRFRVAGAMKDEPFRALYIFILFFCFVIFY